MKRPLLLVIAAVIVIGVALLLGRIDSKRNHKAVEIPTDKVKKGELLITLAINGILESSDQTPVRSDIGGVLISICKGNSEVQEGDFVFQLDTKELELQKDKLLQDLADAEEELLNTEADGEVRITQAETDADDATETLNITKEKAQAERDRIAAEVKYKEGELEKAREELKRNQRLAELQYIPGTKLRSIEREFRAKEFQLEQLKEEQKEVDLSTGNQVKAQEMAVELAMHSLTSTEADVRVRNQDATINLANAQRRLDEVEEKIEQSYVTAPVAGMVVIETNTTNWPERRPYQLGDQIQAGTSPVQIYDFTKMQVRCQIGEMDISRVKKDQPAYVFTSAEPDKRFQANVELVEELAQEANVWQGGTPGKKIFGVLIVLLETDPLRLRPGMTADVEIILDRVPETLKVPIRCVFSEKDKSFVYVQRENNRYERVPVTTGLRNDLEIAVEGKLNPGDVLALKQPASSLIIR